MMLVSNGSEDKATGIYSGLIGRAWWQLLPAVSSTAVVPHTGSGYKGSSPSPHKHH